LVVYHIFISDRIVGREGLINKHQEKEKKTRRHTLLATKSGREFDFYHDVFDDLVECE
jgi:hypothetical protein